MHIIRANTVLIIGRYGDLLGNTKANEAGKKVSPPAIMSQSMNVVTVSLACNT